MYLIIFHGLFVYEFVCSYLELEQGTTICTSLQQVLLISYIRIMCLNPRPDSCNVI